MRPLWSAMITSDKRWGVEVISFSSTFYFGTTKTAKTKYFSEKYRHPLSLSKFDSFRSMNFNVFTLNAFHACYVSLVSQSVSQSMQWSKRKRRQRRKKHHEGNRKKEKKQLHPLRSSGRQNIKDKKRNNR
jgi:hypothetical protein